MDIYLVMFLVKTISNPVFDIINRSKMSSNIKECPQQCVKKLMIIVQLQQEILIQPLQ